jgi:transcription elongation factor Elf1
MKLITTYKLHKPNHISDKGLMSKCGKLLTNHHKLSEKEFEKDELFGLIICKNCLKSLQCKIKK